MARPPAALPHNPAAYLHAAFTALHWPGLTFEAAMQCTARRAILDLIATRWPEKRMENIVLISRIDLLATNAARRGDALRSANPYPEHSAPGQLFAKCFDLEQKRLSALALKAQEATKTIANELESEHE